MAQTVKVLPAVQGTWFRSLGLGRSPGEGNGYPLQYSCLENSVDRGAWRANPWAHKELDMTEQLTLPLFQPEFQLMLLSTPSSLQNLQGCWYVKLTELEL